VDPARALSAVNTLRQNPSSLSAVQRFQDDFLGSGVSRLHKVIEEDLKNAGISESSQSTLPDLRLRTTLGALRSALNECRSSVRDAREDMDVAYGAIDELKDELSAVHARAHAEVLGDMDSATSGKTPAAQVNDPVGSALANAEHGVRATLDRLTWWKLLYKVDDVDFIVNSAIAKVWFKDLEPQVGRSLSSSCWLAGTNMHAAHHANRPFGCPARPSCRIHKRPCFVFTKDIGLLLACVVKHARSTCVHAVIRCHCSFSDLSSPRTSGSACSSRYSAAPSSATHGLRAGRGRPRQHERRRRRLDGLPVHRPPGVLRRHGGSDRARYRCSGRACQRAMGRRSVGACEGPLVGGLGTRGRRRPARSLRTLVPFWLVGCVAHAFRHRTTWTLLCGTR
jgi:hypothetical protein